MHVLYQCANLEEKFVIGGHKTTALLALLPRDMKEIRD